MHTLQITAETREKAMEEATRRLGLPQEALEVEWGREEDDELLAGAKPMVEGCFAIREDYVVDRVHEILAGLLDHMDVDGDIETREEPEFTLVSIVDCPLADVLIGRHGETLEALQHLVVRMTGISAREMPLVLVDVGDYRQRRIERLRKVSHTLAEMALENGNEEEFDPMSATDRKVVHTIVKEIDGVKSYSRGEGESRRVVVSPE